MNAIAVLLLSMSFAGSGLCQYVEKGSGTLGTLVLVSVPKLPPSIDLNGDGVDEEYISVAEVGSSFTASLYLDKVSGYTYTINGIGQQNGEMVDYSCLLKSRSSQQFEIATNFYSANFAIVDGSSYEVLFETPYPNAARSCVVDWDGDGLDDLFLIHPGITNSDPRCYNYTVYGLDTGATRPPAVGDLQATSDGELIYLTWEAVPEATSYKVMWASEYDSPCYAPIGTTSATSFSHGQINPDTMGFYKVYAIRSGGGGQRLVARSAP